ncbi:hypothetical protein JCM3766R1_000083 [Sporobolomyces carnicolor]
MSDAPDGTITLADALAAALASFTQLENQLTSFTPDDSTRGLQTALANAGKGLLLVECSPSAARLQAQAEQWQGLERAGKSLWNRARLIGRVSEAEDEGSALWRKKLLAKLRHLSLRAIRLHIGNSTDAEESLLIFELMTQTALAYLDIGKISAATAMQKEAASVSDVFRDFSPLEQKLRSRCALATLNFYVLRIRILVHTGPLSIAQWLRGKLEELIEREKIPTREVYPVVEAFYCFATSILLEQKAADPGDKKGLAIESLKRAKRLVDPEEARTAKALKARNEVDEEAVSFQAELVALEPTFARKRRLLAMQVARDGTDLTISSLFETLVPDAIASEEQGLAHVLGFDIIRKLTSSTAFSLANANDARIAASLGRFLEQLVSIAAVLLKASDLESMSELLGTLQSCLPSFRLSPTPALLVATHVQSANKSVAVSGCGDTARWSGLLLASPLASLEPAFLAQNTRMIASTLIQAGRLDEAEQALQSEGGCDARVLLLRYEIDLARGDVAKAIERLDAFSTASNSTSDGLVWAASRALKAAQPNVYSLVVDKLVENVQDGRGTEGIDPATAARFLVRLSVNGIEAAQLAAPVLELRNSSSVRRAAIETCGRLASLWNPQALAKLYGIVTSIVKVELTASNPTQELLEQLFACRLASLAATASALRGSGTSAQGGGYEELLPDLETFVQDLEEARRVHGDHLPETASQKFVNAIVSLQAECHVSLGHWDRLLALVDICEGNDPSNESTVIALRLLCDQVSHHATECPYEILRAIYRKVLPILYGNRALTSGEMAVWLRMVIQILVVREPIEAFKYLENARELVATAPDDYPKEETQWLISTAWDQVRVKAKSPDLPNG